MRILLCFPQKSENATTVLSQGQSGFKKVSDNPSIFCYCFWATLGLWLCALWLCVQKLLMAGPMDHIGCWTIKVGSTRARQMFSQLCYYQYGPCSSFLTRPLWCRLCSLNILCICLCYGQMGWGWGAPRDSLQLQPEELRDTFTPGDPTQSWASLGCAPAL